MLSKKISIIFIILFSLCFSLTVVSASQDNITADELTVDENINIETSNIDEKINIENSNNENFNEDKLLDSDEGEFIDVNDAYVYLNQFRNENGVWQWNDDNTTKTVFNTNELNKLQPLARDLTLEETAKIRAKELVQLYSHTRPDGNDCFTAFPEGLTAMGENIAYGFTTIELVTEAWKETNEPYDGQGHRRNMLNSNFNCVGIAGYKLNGTIYWVQDFGYSKNIVEGKIIYPNTNTNTNTISPKNSNSKLVTKITAKNKSFKIKTKTKKYSITLQTGKKAVKKVKVTLKVGKKTYKASTNSKGKATFKIKLTKKGTYNTKIIFKGNKNYKSATKSIKIKIK